MFVYNYVAYCLKTSRDKHSEELKYRAEAIKHKVSFLAGELELKKETLI